MRTSFHTTFAPVIAFMALLTCLLLAKWAGAKETPQFRLPGGCVAITELVTNRDGTQQIVRHIRCEYTQSVLDRLSRTGH